MDELLLLFLLSVAMFACSFVAGSLPLAISLSESKLRIVAALGAGLLVGAALAVIIPEGVGAVYSHGHAAHKPHEKVPEKVPVDVPAAKSGNQPETHADAKISAPAGPELHVEPEEEEQGAWIGTALVLGFVFMLLVDQLSAKFGGGERGSRNGPHLTATLGLVVHAAADGIALGASATTQHIAMEMIVFFAIMLHKAPTAFGLVTFLLHESVDRTRIRRHLLVFSISAPMGALVTYLIISQGNSVVLADSASGLVLLFSGGTFLYVATVHVLPEITGGHDHVVSVESGSTTSTSSNGSIKLTRGQLLALIVGAISPVFLSMKHGH